MSNPTRSLPVDPDARITFTQAARLPAVLRDGRPAHVVTLWRWATRGIRRAGGPRVYLESWCVGGRRLTSRAAVERFIAVLSQPSGQTAPAPAKVLSEHRRAEIELGAAGI